MKCHAAMMTLLLFVIGCGPSQDESAATTSFLDGKWSATIQNAVAWTASDATNPVPHALLNVAYNALNEHGKIKVEYELAYGSSENRSKVKEWAAALVASHPDNPSALVLKGLALEAVDDLPGAIDAYRKAMAVDPSFRLSFFLLGNLYLTNRDADKAIATYSRMLAANPNDADAHTSIAMAYLTKQDMAHVLSHLKKATESDPSNLTAHYNLASAYLQTGATEKGIETLRKIVALDPSGDIGRDARAKLAQLGK